MGAPQDYDDVVAENLRLKAMQPVGQKATLFVVAIVLLCVLTVVAVVVLQIARPDTDNTAVITAVIGVSAPIMITLLAAAVQQVHLAVNSRLSQLLELTAASAQARGQLAATEQAQKNAQPR